MTFARTELARRTDRHVLRDLEPADYYVAVVTTMAAHNRDLHALEEYFDA